MLRRRGLGGSGASILPAMRAPPLVETPPATPRRPRGPWWLGGLLAACGTTPAPAPAPPPTPKEDIAPEAATGFEDKERVVAGDVMVAAANPHAARAGKAMLDAGGTAVDAAIAMAVILTLVEPQSSGIGGGAFLLHYDAASKRVAAWDGRETAPAAATPDMFMDGRRPKGFFDAVVGGLSVGVPGELRMLEAVHRRQGKLPWGDLFAPAIALAEEGFAISPRLHKLLGYMKKLPEMPGAKEYFYDRDGKPKAVGTILKNPALAEVLRAVAEGGSAAFYEGAIAADIAAAVKAAPRNPGRLTEADLLAYQAKEREPVCRPYRRYRVCGMPPPTSGGVTTLQILGLLERFDLSAHEAGSTADIHLFAEAGKLAYADRGRFLADPDFVDVPVEGLLDPDYLKGRAALIDPAKAMAAAAPGDPVGTKAAFWADDASPELPSTSHLVAIDGEGDVVSMTASIESAFGSHLMVRGFLLNNELTDFSFVPEVGGKPVANRVEAGKRPRSSMAPIIVLDEDGGFVLAVGSPGGSRIIPYVAQTLIAVLDHGLDLQAAIARPHVANRNGPTELEKGVPGFEAWADEQAAALEKLGHEVKLSDMNSGLHAIQREDGALHGAADPRREGLVLGN